ncbi:hypothetical protein FB45DRAFT_1065210 [Roridomyces roridus]|uniref:MYND-type domain-containing protein n=1 Tax=Roridomyces roridus TaxID=1738132 RepID=A0AAD7FDZ4_9AGAR|nr:hypothetical protein FB45DRAFT_1065210 [Roridomyces roridus]
MNSGAGHLGQPTPSRGSSFGSLSGHSTPLPLLQRSFSSSSGTTSRQPASPVDTSLYLEDSSPFNVSYTGGTSQHLSNGPPTQFDAGLYGVGRGSQGAGLGVEALQGIIFKELSTLREEGKSKNELLEKIAEVLPMKAHGGQKVFLVAITIISVTSLKIFQDLARFSSFVHQGPSKLPLIGRNPAHPVWLHTAVAGYQALPVVAENSDALHELRISHPHINTWLPPADNESSIAAPALSQSKSTGRKNIAQGINTTARYLQHNNGQIIDGYELGRIGECLRRHLADLHDAGLTKPRVDELGQDVITALVYQLEKQFPYVGCCTDHWKAMLFIKNKYRDWLKNHRNITGDGDVVAGKKRTSTEEQGGPARKRPAANPLDDPALIEMPDVTGGSGDGVQPPTVTPTTPTQPTVTQTTTTQPTVTQTTTTQPTVTQPTVTQPTVTQPTVTQPTVTQPTVTQPTVTPTASTQTTPTPATNTENTQTTPANTEITPPAPTTRRTRAGLLYVLALSPSCSSLLTRIPALRSMYLRPPAANSSTTSPAPAATPTVNPAKPKLDSVTARNIAMAVYAADVGGSNPQFGAHWTALRENCPLLYQAYEKYSKELKQKGVKELPDLEAIRGVVAVVPASECDKVDEKKNFRRCSLCNTAAYCSPACQRTDWTDGHREDCHLFRGSVHEFGRGWIAYQERSFIRALVTEDYRRLRVSIAKDTIQFMAKNPDTPFSVCLNYADLYGVEVTGWPLSHFDFLKPHLARVAHSNGRVVIHWIRIPIGAQDDSVAIWPLRATSLQFHDGLVQISRQVIANGLKDEDVEALVQNLIEETSEDNVEGC